MKSDSQRTEERAVTIGYVGLFVVVAAVAIALANANEWKAFTFLIIGSIIIMLIIWLLTKLPLGS